jgi:serine/threonine protein kinase/formylglycine-generating enzyme required for sulfatase activity
MGETRGDRREEPGERTVPAAKAQAEPGGLPDRIGPYKILDQLGEGGMGTVYLAEQREPVRRRVALKVIKLGMDSVEVLRRFELERQALALMEHPNIAKIFDVGTTERGQPYFAMEFVKGRPITEFCDHARLDLGERLRLFQQVCSGVQHAHQKGITHRDLTPRNVLVTDQDGEPRPKIIDFGLARATDTRLAEGTIYTQQDQVFGTPAYMSPEQAGFEHVDVDTRSDVYTLGVLLYELLTGERPFEVEARGPASFLELRRRICETDPALPSAKVVTLGAEAKAFAQRRSEPRALPRALRGDLDWIVLRALEKDRTRRYQTANELALDIQRHLEDQPVLAGPPGAAYRVRKFVRRYRLQVVAGLLVLVSLLSGIVGTTWFMFEAKASETRARLAAGAEAEARREAVDNLAKFELLANVVLLREARKEAEALFPERPERAPAMRAWLAERGEPLAKVLPELRRTLTELRGTAANSSAGAEGFRFARSGEQFLHDTLTQLVGDLEDFVAAGSGVLDLVRDRLAWAESVQATTIDAHRAAWDEARRAILRADDVVANARYAAPAIELVPQIGLVPLGMNPATGLFEFYDLRSAAPGSALPSLDATGHVVVGEETGIVFVLLPGGTVSIAGDPSGGSGGDGTARDIAIAPFLIARHELTQGQWQRLARGPNPSYYAAGREFAAVESPITAAHPVEQVSWPIAVRVLGMHGLALPSEAEWEYACRAGTATTWFTGDDAIALAGHANVADASAKRLVPSWTCDERIVDGWVIHAPVGSFLPNAFGLYDTHGNVWEWCADAFGGAGARVMRGGSHTNAPELAGSSNRSSAPPDARSNNLGLRVVRALVPHALQGRSGPR